MKLRYYQEEAKAAIYKFFKDFPDLNPVVVLPTGSGKTPLLAAVCDDIVNKRSKLLHRKCRVLVVSHVKELLEQAYNKIKATARELNVGLYSAGLNSRDTDSDIVVAGVQSVYSRAFELGAFDLVIVDEAHLVPPDGEGMYQTLINKLKISNPKVRLIGLTATPYRLKEGLLCSMKGVFNAVCYEKNVKELIQEGFLCPLKSRLVQEGIDTSGLHIQRGEFVAEEVDQLINTTKKVNAACREIVFKADKYNRQRILIFAASVDHANNIKREIESVSGQECGIILGSTPAAERAEMLARFRGEQVPANMFGEFKQPLKYMVNVGVLTTGFDNPQIDLVAIVRPTASAGLYYQMVGRGLRLAPGKDYCLILDFGQNIDRHGPIDEIRISGRKGKGHEAPVKSCPKCELIVPAAARKCPDCNYEFPFEEHESALQGKASKKNVVSANFTDVVYNVDSVDYTNHVKATDVSKTHCMKVVYNVIDPESEIERKQMICEWVCPEHQGYARRKFEDWWKKRCEAEPPLTVREAISIGKSHMLAEPRTITVRKIEGEKFSNIISYDLPSLPQYNPSLIEEPVFGVCYQCIYYEDDFCVKNRRRFRVDSSTPCCEWFSKSTLEEEELPF